MRTPHEYDRSTQSATRTRSHGRFSRSEALLARTTIESSPVSMRQRTISTSREQLTWMPSLFGKFTSDSTAMSANRTRSQSWTQKLHPAGGLTTVTPSTRTSRQPAKKTRRGGETERSNLRRSCRLGLSGSGSTKA